MELCQWFIEPCLIIKGTLSKELKEPGLMNCGTLSNKLCTSVCSKCLTLKTSYRTASIQVQFISYQCQHGNKGNNRSKPNQWARSQLICFTRTSYQCQHGHKLLIDQCQTDGPDLSSYVSMRTKLLLSP